MSKPFIRCLAIVFCLVALSSVGRAEPLRYRIEPNKTVAYTVTITADTPQSVETMKGVIAFTGKSSQGDRMTVQYQGGLGKSTQSKRQSTGRFGRGFGPPGGFPPIPRGPFDRPDFRGLVQSSSTLVMTTTGVVEKMQNDSQLPYLLGNLAFMPFPMLPEGEQNQWKEADGLTIKSKSASNFPFGPRFGPFADDGEETTRTGGRETSSYRITSENQGLVSIEKTYTLSSPSTTGDDKTFEMKGSGTWVFNRDLGVSESMDFKLDFAIKDRNTTVTVPITIQWSRMPEQEYAAMVKEREERMAQLRKQAEERREKAAAEAKAREGKPLPADEKQAIMADLNASKWPTISQRLRKLKGFKPHPDDFDVALKVKELRSHKVVGVNLHAKRLWESLEPILDEAEQNGVARSPSSTVPNPAAGAAPTNPFTVKPMVSNARQMRTWSDDSGTFQVEAKFVRLDGSNVVLTRKDGKELVVPVSRLSKADRDVVEALKNSPAPTNPFE